MYALLKLQQMGVPVRLLSPLEWKAILPVQLKDRYVARENNKLTLDELLRLQREHQPNRRKGPFSRAVGCEYDGKLFDIEDLPRLDQDSYQSVPVRFIRENVSWIANETGLPFLDGRGFGELLNNLSSGHAAAVCAAYGRTMQDGDINTADHAIYSTYKHHGQKIGFRVCSTQRLDS